MCKKVFDCMVYYHIKVEKERSEKFSVKEQKYMSQKLLEHAFLDFFGESLEWNKIIRGEDGKPVYALKGRFFNISHCSTGVAVAVARVPVGVDMEGGRKIRNFTVKKCMDEGERTYIGIGDGEWLAEEQIRRFLYLWTLKESYVKMTGTGIRVPFHQICFDIPDFPEGFEGEKKMVFAESRVFAPWQRNSISCLMPMLKQSLALTLEWEEDALPAICPREMKDL